MNIQKRIARKIEKDIGYTNGCRINDEKYQSQCKDTSLQICQMVAQRLEKIVNEGENNRPIYLERFYHSEIKKLIQELKGKKP